MLYMVFQHGGSYPTDINLFRILTGKYFYNLAEMFISIHVPIIIINNIKYHMYLYLYTYIDMGNIC